MKPLKKLYMKRSKDINCSKNTIPDDLVDKIKHWSHWSSADNKRLFLIVDSYELDSLLNPTDVDFVWLLELTRTNPDGSRIFTKFATIDFIQLLIDKKLNFIDPTKIKINGN